MWVSHPTRLLIERGSEVILHLRVSHPQSMRSPGGKDGEQKKNKTASDLNIIILTP